MIVLAHIENLFVVSYFSQQHSDGLTCFFDGKFLPVKTLRSIRKLKIFNYHGNAFLRLTPEQQQMAMPIFQKMQDEENSGYLFSAQLQQTYLMELLHFIVKNQAALKSFDPAVD